MATFVRMAADVYASTSQYTAHFRLLKATNARAAVLRPNTLHVAPRRTISQPSTKRPCDGICRRTASSQHEHGRLRESDGAQAAYLVHPGRPDRLPPGHLHPGTRCRRLGDG